MSPPLDVLIVGAGPAGLGAALALDTIDNLTFGIVDRGAVGQTFLDWPDQQKFLTPSFTSNGFAGVDLNAIHPSTSPAHSLGTDYPTGVEYATYLRGVVRHFALPVLENTDVHSVTRHDSPDGGGYVASTSRGPVPTRAVIWASGEFRNPSTPHIPGAELTTHSSTPDAWAPHDGHVIVLGGYESGLDIAQHHIARGNGVTVLDGHHPWEDHAADPSFSLSARTRRSLRHALASRRLTLVPANARTVVHDRTTGRYTVTTDDGVRLSADSPPIAATGFDDNLGPVENMFTRTGGGWPELDDTDQSTISPGLYLSGPAVRHDDLKFCFIYKFRGRSAHVARAIGARLGCDSRALDLWQDAGMLLDDLTCCGTACSC